MTHDSPQGKMTNVEGLTTENKNTPMPRAIRFIRARRKTESSETSQGELFKIAPLRCLDCGGFGATTRQVAYR